jgi:hypothetical protein
VLTPSGRELQMIPNACRRQVDRPLQTCLANVDEVVMLGSSAV